MTDQIESFTKRGVKVVRVGVEADIIVSATGLDLQFFGGVDIQVDSKAVLAKTP